LDVQGQLFILNQIIIYEINILNTASLKLQIIIFFSCNYF